AARANDFDVSANASGHGSGNLLSHLADLDDADGDAQATLTFINVTEPFMPGVDGQVFATTHGGSITVNADGTFQYKAAEDYVGDDSFTYTVIDDNGTSSSATVTLHVPPEIAAARDFSLALNESSWVS